MKSTLIYLSFIFLVPTVSISAKHIEHTTSSNFKSHRILNTIIQPDDSVKTFYVVSDAGGNVTNLIESHNDGSLTMANTYEYGPFGQVVAKTENVEMPYQFNTKMVDAETGLNYYGFRFYDSADGRWLNRDPISVGGGINLYNSVSNNMVNGFGGWVGLIGGMEIAGIGSLSGSLGVDNNGLWLGLIVDAGFAAWDTVQYVTDNIDKNEYRKRMAITTASAALNLATGVGGAGVRLAAAGSRAVATTRALATVSERAAMSTAIQLANHMSLDDDLWNSSNNSSGGSNADDFDDLYDKEYLNIEDMAKESGFFKNSKICLETVSEKVAKNQKLIREGFTKHVIVKDKITGKFYSFWKNLQGKLKGFHQSSHE